MGAGITAVLVGVLPTIGVGLLFWFVMRTIIRADRNERAAIAAQEAAPGTLPPLPATPKNATEPSTGDSAE